MAGNGAAGASRQRERLQQRDRGRKIIRS